MNNFNWNLDYIVHHGVKGQKWGIRRYQDYDGHLIKDRYVLKAGTSLTRYSKHKDERKHIYGKYVSQSKRDQNNYLVDAVFDRLGFKSHKNLYKIKISTIDNASVRNGRAMVEDVLSKIGDKKVNEAFDNLVRIGYVDAALSTKSKMFNDEDDHKTNYHIQENRAKVAKSINKYMKDHLKDIEKEYADKGYDAIIDPEDYMWDYDTPMILLNDKKFKEVLRKPIPKSVEEKIRKENSNG